MHLEKIVAYKKEEVEINRRKEEVSRLWETGKRLPPPRPFIEALLRGKDIVSVIAEIKRASPSRGPLVPDLEVTSLAHAYREGGATALSVLTESRFFKGSLEDLAAVREAVDLPVLRKDFLVDPWQLYQSRAVGADAVLLIAAVLEEKTRLEEFIHLARELHLQPLVEVHGREELEMVLQAGADLVGINNRNLRSFQVNLELTEDLAAQVPPGVVTIGESGVHRYEDVRRMQQAGVKSVLVGEALVCSSNPADKLRELRGVSKCG